MKIILIVLVFVLLKLCELFKWVILIPLKFLFYTMWGKLFRFIRKNIVDCIWLTICIASVPACIIMKVGGGTGSGILVGLFIYIVTLVGYCLFIDDRYMYINWIKSNWEKANDIVNKKGGNKK